VGRAREVFRSGAGSGRRAQRCKHNDRPDRDKGTNASPATSGCLLDITGEVDGVDQELRFGREEPEGADHDSDELSVWTPQPVGEADGEEVGILGQLGGDLLCA